MLAQVDEMLDWQERERCCQSLKKELVSIEDDIRFELLHDSKEFCYIAHFHFSSPNHISIVADTWVAWWRSG